ncbi:C39 family peptidase [Spiroplasma endosymbiont of Megaselia nigra]|uniref:C39 family peptidase n=1 Tax=Spiroplasma endosymbiont of Megaselia nigra TaxID=2478537 RepID=UPI0013150C4E|nr:C39 family peptidase [Spiroplasma endosymbiont of Megaselia nigra]
MKKLLSLLSVLTIGGTAVPTTTAASPYQKEEINNDINLQINNDLEKLNRVKRGHEEFFLKDPNNGSEVSRRFSQGANYWCGPASVEWILRHFQLNTDAVLNIANNGRVHRYVNFQHYLSDLMRTHSVQSINQSIGTRPVNLVNVINSFINNNNLNNRRQYESMELQPEYNNYSQFYNIVSNSLRNNMPVVFGFTGVMPGEFENHNHFVIITGFDGDNSDLETIEYTYMDPGYGRFRHFSANWLNEAIRNNSGFLIHYNQIESQETQIPRPNQTEPMDFSGQNIRNIYRYFENCGTSLNNRYIRSNSNNNQYCKNSTIYGNKINIFKIANTVQIANLRKGDLKLGDTYIGTTNGLYFLRNNILKKINYVNGNIINISLKSRALTAENQNGTIYQVDYDVNNTASWLSGPTPPE